MWNVLALNQMQRFVSTVYACCETMSVAFKVYLSEIRVCGFKILFIRRRLFNLRAQTGFCKQTKNNLYRKG